jgi:hypothetical protein
LVNDSGNTVTKDVTHSALGGTSTDVISTRTNTQGDVVAVNSITTSNGNHFVSTAVPTSIHQSTLVTKPYSTSSVTKNGAIHTTDYVPESSGIETVHHSSDITSTGTVTHTTVKTPQGSVTSNTESYKIIAVPTGTETIIHQTTSNGGTSVITQRE